MKYKLYKTNGTIEVIDTGEEPITIPRIRELVGRNVRAVKLKNGNHLLVDEDAYIDLKKHNPHFTELDIYMNLETSDGYLCGDALEGTMTEFNQFMGLDL